MELRSGDIAGHFKRWIFSDCRIAETEHRKGERNVRCDLTPGWGESKKNIFFKFDPNTTLKMCRPGQGTCLSSFRATPASIKHMKIGITSAMMPNQTIRPPQP
ncbi:hypothetical protein TNCV_2271101 [Trichonephila clavipes]|nr:hypothetical protein TNCV_2271101 [Trichonephila clavipes]